MVGDSFLNIKKSTQFLCHFCENFLWIFFYKLFYQDFWYLFWSKFIYNYFIKNEMGKTPWKMEQNKFYENQMKILIFRNEKIREYRCTVFSQKI